MSNEMNAMNTTTAAFALGMGIPVVYVGNETTVALVPDLTNPNEN